VIPQQRESGIRPDMKSASFTSSSEAKKENRDYHRNAQMMLLGKDKRIMIGLCVQREQRVFLLSVDEAAI